MRPSNRTESPAALVHNGFFALRMPALPLDELRQVCALAAPGLEGSPGAESVSALTQAGLRRFASRPEVRLALLLASPTLDAAVERWLTGSDTGRHAERTCRSLLIYLARMAARTTPFGLFASHSLGRVAEQTCLRLEPLQACRTHTQLDGDAVLMLVRALESDPVIRSRIRFLPNAGLYPAAGQLRYAEAVHDAASRKNRYCLRELQATRELMTLLKAASGGATAGQLCEALHESDPAITPAHAATYVEELIQSQVLQSELTPPATGQSALRHLADTLMSRGLGEHPQAQWLEGLSSGFASLDLSPPADALGAYRVLVDELRTRCPGSAASGLQVDLHRPAPELRLGKARVEEIARALPLIHAICPPRPREDLKHFKEAFRARYQDRELPLMEVLDEDIGIGFDLAPGVQASTSPLLAGMPFNEGGKAAGTWRERDAVLLRLLCQSLSRGETVMRLGESEQAALKQAPEAPLPLSLAVNLSLLGSPADIESDRGKMLWHGAFGPSGALYFGRFCGGDPDLEAEVRRLLEHEEALNPQAIHAELVHVPQGRTANVVGRPVLRPYEIPYVARSGVPRDHQITVQDLRVSVSGDRIRLRSASLGREVLPRMTAAHNASSAELGVYRFLSALRVQDCAHWLAWDWGPLQSAPFLPRVEIDRIVLSRARWRLTQDQVDDLVRAGESDPGQLALGRHRLALRLPRWVSLVEGDRLLPLNLDHPACLGALEHLARRGASLDLVEALVDEQDLCAQTPDGLHTHEIVVPFTSTEQPSVRAPLPKAGHAETGPPARTLLPGDEWIYLKVYCGWSSLDKVLLERLRAPLEAGIEAGDVRSWYFLRYSDPDPHLRLRLRVPDPARRPVLQQALSQALAPLVRRAAVWRVQFDTYDREIERYGGPAAIECAEAVFHADSVCALGLLGPRPDRAEDERWMMALLSAHHLMEDVALPLPSRIQVLGDMREALMREFAGGQAMRRALDQKFRQFRPLMLDALGRRTGVGGQAAARSESGRRRQALFEARSRALVEPLRGLARAVSCPQEASATMPAITLSLCHMSLNRLLRSASRAQEMVIYDGLLRLYQGDVARSWPT